MDDESTINAIPENTFKAALDSITNKDMSTKEVSILHGKMIFTWMKYFKLSVSSKFFIEYKMNKCIIEMEKKIHTKKM